MIDTQLITKSAQNNFKTQASNVTIRKKNILGTHITNQEHIKNNDQNIFDINNISSLSKFSVYDGDEKLPHGLTKSSISINNKGNINFESGIIGIGFKNDQVKSLFETKYDAKLQSKIGDTYVYKINLDKNLSINIEDSTKSLNKLLSEDIKDIQFSSVSSLKTFAVFADFITNNSSSINSIEFNIIRLIDKRRDIGNEYSNGYYGYIKPGNASTANQVIKNWEVSSTGYDLAHKYTTGKNVIVSIIDSGVFGYPTHPKLQGKDGNSRLIYDFQHGDDISKGICNSSSIEQNNIRPNYPTIVNSNESYNEQCGQENHPFYVSMVGFGSKDTNLYRTGTGVAPDTKIIPYSLDLNVPAFQWAGFVSTAILSRIKYNILLK